MGMMAKMRSLAPWFIITVGGLFVLFMVFSDASVNKLATRGNDVVGYIGDDGITYKEFSAFVEKMREQQVKRSGKEIPADQMDAFRNQVWETMVNQRLIAKKIKDLGFTVTDDEIKDALLGANPPAELQKSFIDSTGKFNREAYLAAMMDPKNKKIVLQIEAGIRQELIQKKLQDYLNATILVSESDVKRDFEKQNLKASADFAFVNYRFIDDSLANVTENEEKDYYNKNIDDYKVEEQRKIKYVLFKKQASADDSLAIEKNLKEILKDLKKDTSSFKTYVKIYSDKPYSRDTLSLDKIPEKIIPLLQKSKIGDVIGPVLTREGYLLVKYDGKIRTKNPVVKASHILISNRTMSDSKAKAKAYKIYKKLKNGADFSLMAMKESDDPGSKIKGGDLGWFGKGQMVPAFEKASFRGRIGVVQKPIKTRYGYHIIKVTNKSKYKYIIEELINKIEPSGITIDKINGAASDFSYLAKKNDFTSEANLVKYKIIESKPFKENDIAISGLGVSKPLVKFAFENSVGDVSDVYKVPSGYVVAMVSEVIPAGHKPFDKVKNQIKYKLVNQKKVAVTFEIAKKMKVKIGDNPNLSLAAKIFPRVKVSHMENITPVSTIAGVGRDYIFNDYVMTGEIGKVSNAIKGKRGSYIIRITNRTKFDSTAFAIQKNSLRNYLMQQQQTAYFRNWLESLKKEVNVVDLRYKFYK